MTSRSKNLPSGVYQAPADLKPLRDTAELAKVAWFDVNLAGVDGKRAFLAACAKSLRFPRSFGGNWDALADCLKDLCADSVISCRNCGGFAEAVPDDYATALEIFQDAASYWKERGSVLIAVVDVEPQGVRLARFPASRTGI